MPPASCDQHRRHGRACEVRAIGAGLKLVYLIYKESMLTKII